MNIEPDWLLVLEDHEATVEESLAAGEVERQLVFHTYSLGPSAVKPGWFEHWDQLRDNLNQAIGLGWIPDSVLANTLVSQLASARQAADAHDGTLAKSRLQPILDILAPTTRTQIRQEGYDLIFYNVKKLIESTLDTPIPVEPKVRLTPEHSELPLGELYTLTATVENLANQNTPIPDYPLIFQVVEGPHTGIDMIGSTDSLGKIGFSYTGEFLGTDKILVGIGEGSYIIEPMGSVDVTWAGGPDLVIQSFIPPLIRSQGGEPILVTETTANDGNIPAGSSTTRYFLSVDSFIDPFEDRPIGERAVSNLVPEEFSSVSLLEIRLPDDLPAGTYYVGACADAEGAVTELNEENNCEVNQIAIPLEGSPGDAVKPESWVLALAVYQNQTPFDVQWSGIDEGSGISDYSILVSENGGPYSEWISSTTETRGVFPGQSGTTYAFYSVARDQAGNQEDPPAVPDTITMVDATPPLITAAPAPLPNANGWNNGDVTVTFTCSDTESGIATCPAPAAIATEGAGQVIAGTAVDLAGNSASATVAVNLDKTAPELTMPILASPYPYRRNLLFDFGAQDPLSGIELMESTLNGLPVHSNDVVALNQAGPNLFTLSATDRAGNVSTQSLSFDVVNTPPTAEAGVNRSLECLEMNCPVVLDGSGSTDPNSTPGTQDDIVSYAWYEHYGQPDESPLATGSSASVVLPLGEHAITLVVTDTAGAVGRDTIRVTVNPAQLALLELKKAEVEWEDQSVEVKLYGKVALPVGKDYRQIHAVGTARVEISSVADLIRQAVVFQVHGEGGAEWEYEATAPGAGITHYRINWEGAKFDYDQEIHLRSNYLGQTGTTLEIDREGVTEPLTITVRDVTVRTDAAGAVTVEPSTVALDVDADGEIEVVLPFALEPNMVFAVSHGATAYQVRVGDYYTTAVGKFDVEGKFDPNGLSGNSRPATLELEVTLGDQQFPGIYQVLETDWDELEAGEWKYER
ncbi:MAG: hypothetical protein HZA19_01265 [Nitrospirae bacterium]|nr:hypothetical protein [Nitrospirota bacterium]